MRRIALPFLFGILLLTVQATLLLSLPIHRIRPDLLLIFTLWLSFSYPPVSGGILAFSMGYLLDFFSGNSFGFYTFSRTLLFYTIYCFKDHFYLEGLVSQLLLVFISGLLEGLLLMILLFTINPYPFQFFHVSWATVLLPQSAISGFIAPLLFSLFDKGSVYFLRRNELRA